MGVESYLVLLVFTDECCHPNHFRVELMLIESFEIGRLDFPNRDTLKSTHCFCLTSSSSAAPSEGADGYLLQHLYQESEGKKAGPPIGRTGRGELGVGCSVWLGLA